MVKKIESLTEAQKSKFGEYTQKWLDIGLSTEPVDLEKAKVAVNLAYRIAGLKEPSKFYLVDSPRAAIDLIKQLDPSKSESTILGEMFYGCHEAAWLSFYDFFKTEVGLENLDSIEGLIEVAKNVGWLSVYEDVAVLQQRPSSIKFDDMNRVHNEFGPAIEYRDGFAIYSWHGTRIPSEWITNKEKLTPKIALTWENIEQRRCACEILGWAKILKDLKAKTINVDPDPMIGTLVEVQIPDIGKEKFLKVVCGTGREFAIPVPPNMKTALEANAWTYNLSPDEYAPEVRT